METPDPKTAIDQPRHLLSTGLLETKEPSMPHGLQEIFALTALIFAMAAARPRAARWQLQKIRMTRRANPR